MSRYIDADVFMKNLKTNEHGDTDVNQVEIAIDKSRADVVEVVRCKDCKYYHKDAMMPVHPVLGGGTVIENHCDMSCMKLKDNDYCSYAERKGKRS